MNLQNATRAADIASGQEMVSEAARRPRKGDEAGFRKFLETKAEHLYRFAQIRLANDAEAADEVVQATVAEALRNLDTLHSGAHAGAPMMIWVFRLCRLEIKEYLHRRERLTHRQFCAQKFAKLSEAVARLSRIRHQGAGICGDESLGCLAVVEFDRLGELEGAALELKCLGGTSNHEIARLLDITESESRALLTHARVAFRDELGWLARSARS